MIDPSLMDAVNGNGHGHAAEASGGGAVDAAPGANGEPEGAPCRFCKGKYVPQITVKCS